jgi:hypothetical protein
VLFDFITLKYSVTLLVPGHYLVLMLRMPGDIAEFTALQHILLKSPLNIENT